MRNLASPKVIKEILSENEFRFSKSLGQNFLIDENALCKIIDNSCIDENTNIIEIGPGFGTLTQRLCQSAKKVVAIEIDNTVIPILEDNLSEFDNVKIINSDVLELNLNELIENEFDGGDIKVVANLPYYITTPIIMTLLERKLPISDIIIMIQKEVADRILANPGKKDYGALTVAVGYYTVPEIVLTVGPGSFMPPPKVSSSVIKLNVRKTPAVDVDEKNFFKLVKAAFAQRRKTLLNAISNSGITKKSKEEILNALTLSGIDEKARGETLSIEMFAELSKKLF